MFDSLSNFKRTHYCGDLRKTDAGGEVIVMGWVEKRRNLGSLIFVSLRDRSGHVQIIVNGSAGLGAARGADQTPEELVGKLKDVRSEWVIGVRGTVRERSADAINPDMATGKIEIIATEIRLFNSSQTTPFYIRDDLKCDETLRLKYRYLDLRRPRMQKYLILRHKICKATRDYFDSRGFLELETPILTKSTPEGARDYLVPSRVNKGTFFALPQSPQIFKQLFMVSGFDRYFQIVRCFRDEDLRADRQPEFTQVDLEMSFADEADVMDTVEGLMSRLYRECAGVEIKTPFRRMSFSETMANYGVDKPDTRFDMLLHDLSDIFRGCAFKAFAENLDEGGVIKGISVPGCADWSRKDLDGLSSFVKVYGAKGVVYALLKEEEIKSPIAKFMEAGELDRAAKTLCAAEGDMIVMVADKAGVANAALGALRVKLAGRLGLIPSGEFDLDTADAENYRFLWVTDFPLFEWNPEESRLAARHHPFTSPKEEDISLLGQDISADPDRIRARAYDLVLNGTEIGGGSIRIHYRELQEKMFAALGLSDEEARAKFGFLMDAFEYGAPPHGGLALGLDRIIMTMLNTESIRDMIPFPKTQQAQCLMTNAPSKVDEKQLKELCIASTLLP